MNKLTKILGVLFVLLGMVLFLRFVIGGDEDAWICQNGEWVKHGNPSRSQPATPCEKKGQNIEEEVSTGGYKQVSFEESQVTAKNFAQSSSTYKFDGMDLKLESSESLGCPYCWEFNFSFESRSAGYSDRTGEMTAQVITPHDLKIVVKQGEITMSVVDGTFDEIEQEFLK